MLGHLAAMGLLWLGCQGVYVALRNPDPLKITVAKYIAKKPDAEWMTLQEGQMSLLEAAYKARVGKISEIYIPVRPAGESLDAPIHILLSTSDPAVVEALQNLSRSPGPVQKKIVAASRQADQLFMRQDITGLTRYGLFFDFLMHARLAALRLNLAPDFIIVDDGAAPSLYFSLCQIGCGLLMWLFMLGNELRNLLWRWRRRRAFRRQCQRVQN